MFADPNLNRVAGAVERNATYDHVIYLENTWTPAWTGLTVVNGTGAPTYVGTYVRIGRVVYFEIVITVTGTCTTASTAGTTFCNNLPLTAAVFSTLTAANGNIFSYGVGFVSGASAFMPTWSAFNGTITASGFYFV